MQQSDNAPMVDLFLDQFKHLLFRIYRYETLIMAHGKPVASVRHGDCGVDVTEINNNMLIILKLAAWERFDALVDLGASNKAQLVIESCRRIIEKWKELPATNPDRQLA